jgi:hypothetical protein
MRPAYRDILVAAGVAALWWDDRGAPRFAPFAPTMLGVYDQLAVLAEIKCQSCTGRFLIGFGTPKVVVVRTAAPLKWSIERYAATVDFGDPPRHHRPVGGRCAGETMSAVEYRIVEAWEETAVGWVRRSELEGPQR